MGSAKAGSMIVAAADARNLIPLIQEFVPERNSCNIGLYIGTVDDFKGFQTSVVGTVGTPSAAGAAGACFPAGMVDRKEAPQRLPHFLNVLDVTPSFPILEFTR